MSDCHVHFLDERYILKSIHVYHRLFLHYMQKHACVRLFGTIRSPDLMYCIFAFLPLQVFHQKCPPDPKVLHLLMEVSLSRPFFLLKVSFRDSYDLH